ncbi:MAG: hypothetical protein M5U07_21135 [Xanthobacteraceae bacterium]|nr:hypothetical protein [Xanthobacteraceae bacterium]
MSDATKSGNGANGADRLKLTCPCCGSRVGLVADNGGARLELEEAGGSPQVSPPAPCSSTRTRT